MRAAVPGSFKIDSRVPLRFEPSTSFLPSLVASVLNHLAKPQRPSVLDELILGPISFTLGAGMFAPSVPSE